MKALHHLGDNIYWLTFDHRYDLAMYFWRLSETRECPDEQLKENLNLVDYMEWYAKNSPKGVFMYPSDWGGFNVPYTSFKATYSSGNLPDLNKYDKFMHGLRHFIEAQLKKDGDPYYLIGTMEDDFSTLKHEYAHALWSVSPEYQKRQKELIEALDEKVAVVLTKNLAKIGYGEDVLDDELQAYLSTGFELADPKDKFYAPLPKREVTKVARKFVDVFVEFSKGKLPRKKI